MRRRRAVAAIGAAALLLGGCDSAALLMDGGDSAESDLKIVATARASGWRFAYPDLGIAYEGRAPTAADPLGVGMAAPVGRRATLALTAEDGIYGAAIPGLGLEAEALPGRLSESGFLAPEPGVHQGGCGADCGGAPEQLRFSVAAAPSERFGRWADCAARLTSEAPGGVAPAERMTECAALLSAPPG